MITNSEIRAKARAVLGGGVFKKEWLFPVLVLFIISAISGAVAATYVGPIILAGVFSIASAGYFISRVRNTEPCDKMSAAYECVKADLSGSIITGILVNLFIGATFLLIIPALLIFALLLTFMETAAFILLPILMILSFVPGIILSYCFALVYFVKVDHPEMGSVDAMKESMRLMRGYKMKLFGLQLSFIGWSLLGGLCCGIGVLWVNAYMNASYAVFYEELVAKDQGRQNIMSTEYSETNI